MKALIIKPSSMGDIIHAYPVAKALKAEYAGIEISWLVFDSFADIVKSFDCVDKTLVWKKKDGLTGFINVVKEIRKERYDLVIDLQGLMRTALLAVLSGGKKIVGVPNMKELSWLLVKAPFPESKNLHAVERSLESVRYITGKKHLPSFPVNLAKASFDSAEKILSGVEINKSDKLIGVFPYARGKSKSWNQDNYVKLINRILESIPDAKVLVLGTENGFETIENKRVINLLGKVPLAALAGILSMCKVVVGGDTGPIQLASALNIPVVCMFGGSDVKETAPVAKNAVIIKKDFKCSPCRSKPLCKEFNCLKSITVDEVFTALKDILG